MSDSLSEALEAVEPYLDAITCYASTVKEHDGNRVAQLVRAALSAPQADAAAVALYQCELDDGRIEHFAGCFGEVQEVDGVRVVKRTPLYTAPTSQSAEMRKALEQRDRDIGILLANIRFLEDTFGEGLEDIDASMVRQIEREHQHRSALSRAGGGSGTTLPSSDNMDARFAWLEAKAIDMGYVLVPEPEHPDSPHQSEGGEDPFVHGAEDEAYALGKRDGYESAIQDIDLATGGDGEFKGSTIPGETVDVPAMKARIIARVRSPSDPRPPDQADKLEIRELELRYGRDFLRQSLHRVGIRWRELTAPNRRALDREDRE